ncbi:glycoside hydrolase family 18 protein [Paenibacillus sp. sptzw28]|uniref:glycoside hydrolase family 18 protein n=1 Tax=Paenibacillus sp. sptzw28 TaxID=715179 RepID=UPI001C6EC4AA|nr:glycoside hydrolase family 18 protein [Paenibacillus sp. sptzw28]QYR21072.1 glycoside hydrolase family 18 protein [Paenibacillus sp. sptzw28]
MKTKATLWKRTVRRRHLFILSLLLISISVSVFAASKDFKAPAAPTPEAANYNDSGLPPVNTYSSIAKASVTSDILSVAGNPVRVKTKAVSSAQRKKIIGYYAGWSAYSGKQAAQIDGSKLTHINYAFANIGPDLKIALGDPHADTEQIFPNDSPSDPFHGNFNQLLKLKKRYPHLKTFISVGGWSWSGKFSDAALTDASRSAFADSCVAFIVKYGFDGVDIDWEYPVAGGAEGNVKRPQDKQNFTYLMQKLRSKLNAQGAKDGKKYLLSFAGAAGPDYVNHIELSKLQRVVDHINIMTYDLRGTWDSKTGLNAPLYSDPNSGSAAVSVHNALRLYRSKGVPAGKLVVGVPFYGYKFDKVSNVNNGLYQSFSGGKAVSYSQIVSKYIGQGYTRFVQGSAKVPYLYNGSSFISYDDPESIGYKAAYIKQQGLAGAMIWDLSQDTDNHDLLNSLYRGLK